MFTIFTQRNTVMAMSSIACLTLTACASNPTEQVKSQAQEEYRQQAKIANQSIAEAPRWMSKLPKETGVIYENGTAVSSDFAMADLKAKTIAYTKICTGAGGKVRSQMKMYRADNEGASVEQSELIARSICPDVDITGVETVEMKHVAEGNRIRSYVLVALPMGSKNVMKSTKEIQNRSVDAFKELDSITKEQTPQSNTQPKAAAPAVSQAKPAEVITPEPEPLNSTEGLVAEPPAQVQNTNPAPVTRANPNQNQNLPIKESEKSFMNSVQAAGPDAVIVKKPDGTQEVVPLVQSNNPDYVARRAEALRKPGAVIGQATVQ